jgi:hypothetical protein
MGRMTNRTIMRAVACSLELGAGLIPCGFALIFIKCVNKTDDAESCPITAPSLTNPMVAGHAETAFHDGSVAAFYIVSISPAFFGVHLSLK